MGIITTIKTSMQAYSPYIVVIAITTIAWGIVVETPFYGIIVSLIVSIAIGYPVFYLIDKFRSHR